MRNQKNKIVGRAFRLLCLSILLIISSSGFSQKIDFEKDTFDFGKVTYRPNTVKYLLFRNTGSDTLRFLSVPKTSCGCDVGSTLGNKMSYAPGELGHIVYAFDTKNLGKYRKNITIQTNTEPEIKVIFVQWEIVPEIILDSVMDKRLHNKLSFASNLKKLSQQDCYFTSLHYDPPNRSTCDSVRSMVTQELIDVFEKTELQTIASRHEYNIIRLVCFEALSRSGVENKVLTSILEAEYQIALKKAFANGAEWTVYVGMLETIRPNNPYFPKSQKLDLESWVYFNSIRIFPFSGSFGDWKSFMLNSTSVNFGSIDVTNYPLKDDKFVLRGKILVTNISDQLIVVAPYHDGSTRCDKRIYRIQPNEQIEINFWSNVRTYEMNKPIQRTINVLNYTTKEKQTFTFDAAFERY